MHVLKVCFLVLVLDLEEGDVDEGGIEVDELK